jgi:hypothetical protein
MPSEKMRWSGTAVTECAIGHCGTLFARGLKTGPLLCEAQGLDLSVDNAGSSFSVFHLLVTLWLLLERYAALFGNASSSSWWGLDLMHF